MNWKQEAVEKLRRYDAMQRATENIPLEISRLKAESEAMGCGLSMARSGGRNVHQKEDVWMNNLMTRQQLQKVTKADGLTDLQIYKIDGGS